jgi:hypothetical protein
VFVVATSHVAWIVAGGALAVWAVIVGFLGIRSAEFPGSARSQRLVITLSVVLVATAIASAILSS